MTTKHPHLTPDPRRLLTCAVAAAKSAGALMHHNWHKPKKIMSAVQHDIKLELDVRCQKLIERRLRREFPEIPILGEEGILGDPNAESRWVVDPIDGTVNFTHGIPHCCVSIAWQRKTRKRVGTFGGYETMVGVVWDPFANELWTAIRGQPARLNGRLTRASRRSRMDEAIVSLGFAKNRETLRKMLRVFDGLVHRVRKVRIMGAAALAMTYVASGRFDGYLEYGLRLWDIAAAGLIIECAGGKFWWRELEGQWTYEIAANNGPLQKRLLALR